jgi:hypothetical protein
MSPLAERDYLLEQDEGCYVANICTATVILGFMMAAALLLG